MKKAGAYAKQLWQSGTARVLCLFSLFEAALMGYLGYHVADGLIEYLKQDIPSDDFFIWLFLLALLILLLLLCVFSVVKGIGALVTVCGSGGGAATVRKMMNGIRVIGILLLVVYEGYLIYLFIEIISAASKAGISLSDWFKYRESISTDLFIYILETQIPAAVMLLNILYLGNMKSLVFNVEWKMKYGEGEREGTGGLTLQAFLLGALDIGFLIYTYYTDNDNLLREIRRYLSSSEIFGSNYYYKQILLLSTCIGSARYFMVAFASHKYKIYRQSIRSGENAYAKADFKPFFAVLGAVILGAQALENLPVLANLIGENVRASADNTFNAKMYFLTVVPILIYGMWSVGLATKMKNILIFLATALAIGFTVYFIPERYGSFSDFFEGLKKLETEDLLYYDLLYYIIETVFFVLLAVLSFVAIITVDNGKSKRLPPVFNLILALAALALIVLRGVSLYKVYTDYRAQIEDDLFYEADYTFFRLILVTSLMNGFGMLGLAMSVGRNDAALEA